MLHREINKKILVSAIRKIPGLGEPAPAAVEQVLQKAGLSVYSSPITAVTYGIAEAKGYAYRFPFDYIERHTVAKSGRVVFSRKSLRTEFSLLGYSEGEIDALIDCVVEAIKVIRVAWKEITSTEEERRRKDTVSLLDGRLTVSAVAEGKSIRVSIKTKTKGQLSLDLD